MSKHIPTPSSLNIEPTPAVSATTPREGLPPLLSTPAQIADAAATLAAGSGFLALDTERASGFTYSQRAQLIQLRRNGAGSFLIDPTRCADPATDLAPLAAVINPLPWLLHAADQDLPCLRQLGLTPHQLADTLVAGRLLGYQKCNLGHLTEEVLGLHLNKSHGAENWSRRPLPESWLNYAALDVEYLIELWDALYAEALDRGRDEWIRQECEFERCKPDPAPKQDPWRSTSRIHILKNRREMEIVRRLWISRDELASQKDIAPGRLLPDRLIIALSEQKPTSEAEFKRVKGTQRTRHRSRWLDVINAALAVSEKDLPAFRPHAGRNIPHQSQWKRLNPAAAKNLAQCRAVTDEIAQQLAIDAQDLVAGEALRALSWSLTEQTSPPSVTESLRSSQVRPWQISQIAVPLSDALHLPL
ncbi:HRDC domain-containing protein [Lawsonella clevelandensis]|uniref:HRDC domain-containing protein n=1 Tax=Lawsonella clevelandensis TaxID=1528099 RepID=UPI0023F4A5A0|nr:HRDC domain-containing protein [Lawsonella clevelandensis]